MEEDRRASKVPIDRGWAWFIVAGSWLMFFLLGGFLKSSGVLLKEMASFLQEPLTTVTFLTSVTLLAFGISAPFGLSFAERFTSRPIVIIGGCLAFIGVSLSSLAFSIQFIICTYGIFMGIALGCCVGNAIIMVSIYFEKRRALANGLAISGESFGQLILPLLLEFLFNEYSLKGTLLIMGAMFFNIAVCGALFRPLSFYTQRNMKNHKGPREAEFVDIEITEHTDISDKDKETSNAALAPLQSPCTENRPNRNEQQDDATLTGSSSRVSDIDMNGNDGVYRIIESFSNDPLLMHDSTLNRQYEEDVSISCTKCKQKCKCDISILKNYTFVYFLSTTLIAFGILYSATIFLPIHSGIIHEDRFKIASLLSISGAMDLIGRIGSGFLADLKLVETIYLNAICLILAGINCIILAFADEYWWIVLHTVILGLFSGAMPTLMITSLVELVGVERLPKAFTILLVTQQVVSAGYQPFLGWLRDSHETTTVLFSVVGILTLVPGCLMLLTPRIRRYCEQSHRGELLRTSLEVTRLPQ